MATEFHVGGVVLLAPYLSIAKMAQIDYPFIPAEYMVLDRYESDRKIRNVRVPILIVNGTNDQVVPPNQGRQLYNLANDPRQFLSLPNHGHNDLFNDFAPLGLAWADRLQATN